jgi:hypothetical protein
MVRSNGRRAYGQSYEGYRSTRPSREALLNRASEVFDWIAAESSKVRIGLCHALVDVARAYTSLAAVRRKLLLLL